MKDELNWWVENVDTQVRTIHKPSPDLTISTDSSMIGWGCIVAEGQESFNGHWSKDEQEEHINVLEVKAILLAIKALIKHSTLKPNHIRVLSDSTTAVAYVNKMGGITSAKCNDIAKQIWTFCVDRNIWISCQHIPGDINPADAPSRKLHHDLEWQIEQQVFKKICKKLGQPSIDLFASRTNYKISHYCSWIKDPDEAFIDAFSLNWGNLRLPYLFPPFSLVGRCLQKINQEKAEAIMIVALWAQQLWFPFLMRSVVDQPILLPDTSEILHLAHSNQKHPLSPKLKLIACRISGDSTKSKIFRMTQSLLLQRLGEHQRKHSATPTSLSGFSFAVDGRSIQLVPL